jgi:hypothetical protein
VTSKLTTRCGCRRRELELRGSLETVREPFFFDVRLGDGDKSSNVALYAGDLYPSSTVFVGAFGRSQEGFSTHRHGVSPLERNLGNARQWENSATPLVGEEEALAAFGSMS